MALSRQEISHNFYVRRKSQHLCVRCGKPLDRDGRYCSACCEKIRIDARKTRVFLASQHLCTSCGKYAVPVGEKMCPECRAKSSNRKRAKSEKSKINFRKQQKKIYDQRSASGVCVRCGKRKAAGGRKKCFICLQKDAQTHAEARIRRGEDLRAQWKEQGLCFHCGGDIEDKSKKSCNACREKCITKTGAGAGENKAWIEDNRLIFNRY